MQKQTFEPTIISTTEIESLPTPDYAKNEREK